MQKLAEQKLALRALEAPESEPPADKRSVDELLDFIHADRCVPPVCTHEWRFMHGDNVLVRRIV